MVHHFHLTTRFSILGSHQLAGMGKLQIIAGLGLADQTANSIAHRTAQMSCKNEKEKKEKKIQHLFSDFVHRRHPQGMLSWFVGLLFP